MNGMFPRKKQPRIRLPLCSKCMYISLNISRISENNEPSRLFWLRTACSNDANFA